MKSILSFAAVVLFALGVNAQDFKFEKELMHKILNLKKK